MRSRRDEWLRRSLLTRQKASFRLASNAVEPIVGRSPAGNFRIVVERHDSAWGRWTVAAALPQGRLAELVEAVWASRGEGVFTQEEILPRTPTEVLFALGETHWLRDPLEPARDRAYTRAFVSGLQTRPLAVESPANSEMAGIRLRPAAAAAFLRASPTAIAGAVIDLDALLGRGIESLRDQLASVASRPPSLACKRGRASTGRRSPSTAATTTRHT